LSLEHILQRYHIKSASFTRFSSTTSMSTQIPASDRSRVIAVANNKGGVGKTASAAAIAGELARQGYPVLALDLDPQAGNLTAVLHQRGYRGATLLSVLLAEATLEEIIVETKEPNLDLLPASIQLLSQESRLQRIPGYHGLLRKLLPQLSGYAYVVIDCPPSLGDLTSLALTAADVYVIPCQAEQLAFDGLHDMVRAASVVRENLNERLALAGIFFTAYHPNQRGTLNHGTVEATRRLYGEQALLPNIRKDMAVPMSQATQQTVCAYEPNSRAAQDYQSLTHAILATL
jgi:chromosome partitioning protein